MRVVTFINGSLLLMAIVLGGCVPTVQQESSRNSGAPILAAPVEPHVQKTKQKIEALINQGNLAQAHRELLEARSQGVTETSLAEIYTKMENQLLQEAGRARRESHFDRAGKFYRMVLNAYPKQPEVQSGIIMSGAEVDTQIEQCADELMKAGLVAYRGGELAVAVKTWKKISEFHPEYSPAQVAIATAEQQLENLERIVPDKSM